MICLFWQVYSDKKAETSRGKLQKGFDYNKFHTTTKHTTLAWHDQIGIGGMSKLVKANVLTCDIGTVKQSDYGTKQTQKKT